ncbi:MAG: class I SAM-dependent methyltransferase [Acidobacteria bacterium]|nr:class I SAM-dependent methyltransferase [Acidobacteriota bacterium]
MKAPHSARRLLLVVLVAVVAAGAFGHAQQQPPPGQFQPTPGQAGKDVIWLPTSQTLVEKMLDIAKVTAQDVVFDLGSGDGRTVITAAKRGARAHGIEYNPDMVELSKRAAAEAGVSARATFEKADLFESDFSTATVITMFLLPDINLRLRPKILDLKPGTRIVSNSFTMGEWTADDTVTVTEDCTSYCTAYLWIVPAKAAGTWQSAQGELTLTQEFQIVTGSLKNGAGSTPIAGGRLVADQISFTVNGAQYKGRVNGSTIEGTVASNGTTTKWAVKRAQ